MGSWWSTALDELPERCVGRPSSRPAARRAITGPVEVVLVKSRASMKEVWSVHSRIRLRASRCSGFLVSLYSAIISAAPLGTLHAHLGKLVQRLLLIAQIAELRARLRGIVRIASTHRTGYRPTVSAQTATKLTFRISAPPWESPVNKSLQPASGRSQPPVPQTAGRKL